MPVVDVTFILFVMGAAQSPINAELPPDIIVRAVRDRCEIAYAGSVLNGRALKHMADGWPAGRPLRVMEPRGASRKCLIKLTFKLAEQGFNQIQFVDAAAEYPITLPAPGSG
jgi:hypothetical protein